jgi:NTE family protein
VPQDSAPPPRIALVLAGGAARGAYEVGVIDYIFRAVSRDLGRSVGFDILCGTSVGAINACALAAFAELSPQARVDRLVQQWLALRIPHVIRVDSREVLSTVRSVFGRPPPADRHGGLLDPTGLQRIVAAAIPFGKIQENLEAGRLHAVTVSTTHIATGRTIVFVERAEPGLPRWGRDATIQARAVRISAAHALASAAIPFVFPAVMLDGEYHCDGGLRQNVPLSPARRLGADGMLVVSPKYEPVEPPPPHLANEREQQFPTPFFLLGKTLNALMLDRIDNDIDRLQRITALLEAGTRLYGPDFVSKMNRELKAGGQAGIPRHGVRPIQAILIRASQNIAALAADFVRAPSFGSRAPGMVGAVLRRFAAGDVEESDLLSYLLFDGEFARQLIEIGRADARAHHEELCRFFERFNPSDAADQGSRPGQASGP